VSQREHITHLRDLTSDPANRRRHSPRGVGMIERGMGEVGAARSIVIDENGVVLAGNATIEAAAAAGIERVQVVDADGETLIAVRRSGLTDDQKVRLALYDNRTAELSDWNADQLLSDVAAGIDLGQFFKKDELDEILRQASGYGEPAEDPGADIDRAAELQEKWQTEVNQLWAVGRHRLLCADCLDIENVRKLLDGAVPNMIWADPPYGISIVAANVSVGGGEAYDIPFGGRKAKRLGSADAAKPFGSKKDVRGTDGAAHIVDVGKYAPVIGDETTDTAIKSSGMLLAEFPDAAHIWWGGNYYADTLPPSACWLVWNKETTGNFSDCELAWTNQDKAAKLFTHKWNGMLRDSERGKRWHPTQKPSALAAWAFQELGAEGDVVLDTFCGSGPSMVAGEQTGRSVMAGELSPAYCAVILERLSGMNLKPDLLSA
jgi:hypothetical protein